MKNFFKLEERGTTAKREIIAGITTFLTMAYVLAVQPSAIIGFGTGATFVDASGVMISRSALVVTCALVSGIITILMGLHANIPVALSTAMGTNFVVGGLISSGQFSLGWAMALILCAGILFILITVLGIRTVIVKMIPKNLKIGMTSAIGFFVAYLGFKNTGLATFDGGLGMGDFTTAPVLLTLLGLAVMAILTVLQVRGAILVGILVVTVAGIPLGVTALPEALFALPDVSAVGNLLFCYDFQSVFANIPNALVWLFILFTGDFFGTFSCLTAIGAQSNMLDENGDFPQIEKPFLVDAIGTVLGSATGCTTISSFIESTVGVQAGGRTGLASVVTGLLFFVCILFAPLFLMIPNAASGAALIFVGFSMLSNVTKLDFSNFRESFGAIVMILFATFTGNIAGSICLGILSDVLLKVFTGKAKEVHPFMYVLCIPLIFYFVI